MCMTDVVMLKRQAHSAINIAAVAEPALQQSPLQSARLSAPHPTDIVSETHTHSRRVTYSDVDVSQAYEVVQGSLVRATPAPGHIVTCQFQRETAACLHTADPAATIRPALG